MKKRRIGIKRRENIAYEKLKPPQYKCQIKAHPQCISSSVNVKFNDHTVTTPTHPLIICSDIALFYMLENGQILHSFIMNSVFFFLIRYYCVLLPCIFFS